MNCEFGDRQRLFDLICFDVDGTLIDDTVFIWQTIHEALGTDEAVCREISAAFHRGEISYAEWASSDVAMWKARRAGRRELLTALRHIRPMLGARETLTTLKQAGFKIGIVSGSLDLALDLAFPDWRELFDSVLLNRLVFDDDGLVSSVIPTDYDMNRKGDGLLRIAAEWGVPQALTVFVGDHYNDLSAAQVAGKTIAFNCKDARLAAAAAHVVPGPDIRRILPYLFK